MERLKVALWVKPPKLLELKQTLDHLSEKLQEHCFVLKIKETNNLQSHTIIVEWETEDQMRRTFKSNEFKILSGAITALCKKSTIHLNNKLVGNHISLLTDINKQKFNIYNHE